MREGLATGLAVLTGLVLLSWIGTPTAQVSAGVSEPHRFSEQPHNTALYVELRESFNQQVPNPFKGIGVLPRDENGRVIIRGYRDLPTESELKGTLKRVEPVLVTSARIETDRLSPCEARDAFRIEAALRERKRRVEDALVNGDFQREGKTTEPGLDLSRYSMDATTRKLTGRVMSYDALLTVADQEKALIERQLAALETRIIENGLALSLEEYAAHPSHLLDSAEAIEETYQSFAATLQPLFIDQFYAYDIDPPGVRVLRQAHPMRAIGAYSPKQKIVLLYNHNAALDRKALGFLAIHEDWPGHHLEHQAKTVPGFCENEKPKFFSPEAWATYAETLADEAGGFDDPAMRLGWLDYRMIRVGRIYMDVKHARDDLAKHELRDVWEAELPTRLHHYFDREYARVFQARPRFRHHHLNYILGRRTIEFTKAQLKAEWGEAFDARKFHHLLLTGSHPSVDGLLESLRAGLRIKGDPDFGSVESS